MYSLVTVLNAVWTSMKLPVTIVFLSKLNLPTRPLLNRNNINYREAITRVTNMPRLGTNKRNCVSTSMRVLFRIVYTLFDMQEKNNVPVG